MKLSHNKMWTVWRCCMAVTKIVFLSLSLCKHFWIWKWWDLQYLLLFVKFFLLCLYNIQIG